MAFKIEFKERVLNIVGLMDIIFLLLIFGMVVSAVLISTGTVNGRSDRVETMKIYLDRVERENGPNYSTVNIIMPGETRVEEEHIDFPEDPELFDAIRNDRLGDIAAFEFIREKLVEYHNSIRDNEDKQDFIRMKIDSRTPLGIIDFVFKECHSHIDTIEWVKINTLEQ